MSVKYTISGVYRGDRKDWDLEITDEANNKVNLAYRTVYFTAKLDKSDPDSKAVIRKASILPDNETSQNGIYNLVLESSDTLGIEQGTYHWDIRFSYPVQPNEIFATAEGIIEIEQPVTLLDGFING